jgi:GGDEF domain-containing protein
MVFHDVSKERRLHRALHYQASHDALTGLINRREFENRLTAAVESARAGCRQPHALLYLDLDQFKLVNDTCGHPAGDQLLKQITGVLQSRVRSGDTLARWAATSSASCCRTVRSTRRCASPRRCARRSAITASSGRTACSRWA